VVIYHGNDASRQVTERFFVLPTEYPIISWEIRFCDCVTKSLRLVVAGSESAASTSDVFPFFHAASMLLATFDWSNHFCETLMRPLGMSICQSWTRTVARDDDVPHPESRRVLLMSTPKTYQNFAGHFACIMIYVRKKIYNIAIIIPTVNHKRNPVIRCLCVIVEPYFVLI
jgi:hypothetical protein